MDLRNFFRKAEPAPDVRPPLPLPPLPYLAELNEVMNDPAVRKGATLRTMRKMGYTIVPPDAKFLVGWLLPPRVFRKGATDVVASVFGTLMKKRNREGVVVGKETTLEDFVWKDRESQKFGSPVYIHRRWERNPEWGSGWRVRAFGVCGIEVLGQRPNATGHTYSNSCDLTIKALKLACKENGIKVGGMKKTEMLHALMKV